jgi:hypothetical protein
MRSVRTTGLVLAVTALALAIPPSCSADAPSGAAGEEAGGAPATDAGGDAGPACAPTPVPAELRASLELAPFYAKVVMAGELPIVSSALTPDDALCTARAVVLRMVEHRPEILARLADKKIRLAIMASSEVTTDVPEHADLTPKEYWD